MIPIWDSTASLLTAPPAPLLASGYAAGNTLAAQHYNYQFYHLTKELNAVLTAAGVGQNAAIDNQLLTSLYALISVSGTAAALASSNPVLRGGEIAYETDTISYKIGDGSTAYNSLTYVYRGLPVASEPSLGTLHQIKSPSEFNALNAGTASVFTDVDLSALIPVGSKGVLMECMVQATATAAAEVEIDLYLQTKGYSYLVRGPQFDINPGINGTKYRVSSMKALACDGNRKIQYKVVLANAGTPAAWLTAVGYYI